MVQFYSPAKKVLSQKTIKLSVQSIDAFGQGIAHHQGKTVFIKNALPAEEVEVKLTEDKKHYAKAKVIKYCSLSEMRMAAKCPHYEVCGGCEMQHISTEMQHTVKAIALSHLFKQETNTELAISDIDIVTSKPYHYRRRARLAIRLQNNKLVIGFRQAESSQIVDINTCPVLVDELEQLLIPLKTCLNRFIDKKVLGHIELIHTDSGVILVLKHIRPLTTLDSQQLVKFARQRNLSLYLHGEALVHLTGNHDHYYSIEQLKLTFSPLNFIQVNSEINFKMIKQAISWLNLQVHDNVLDLFCGMGNFSLPMATICHQVIGVEGVPTLVAKAKANAILNQDQLNGSVAFLVANLDSISKETNWYSSEINKVLLDPARAGADHVMDKIVEHSPAHVVYISCNPATLVRDSKKLLRAGYTIANVSILDMFPQTKHIEAMLLFTKLGIK